MFEVGLFDISRSSSPEASSRVQSIITSAYGANEQGATNMKHKGATLTFRNINESGTSDKNTYDGLNSIVCLVDSTHDLNNAKQVLNSVSGSTSLPILVVFAQQGKEGAKAHKEIYDALEISKIRTFVQTIGLNENEPMTKVWDWCVMQFKGLKAFSIKNGIKASEKEISNVTEVLHKGWVAPGTRAAELERQVAELSGKNFGLMTNSRKSALFLAISSICREGINVLIPKNTEISISEMLKQCNCTTTEFELDNGKITDKVLETFYKGEHQVVVFQYPIQASFDIGKFPNAVFIEDMGSNICFNPFINVSIVTFENLCAIAAYADEDAYNGSLSSRDWGRIGTQDEDMVKRYSNCTLGNGVPYDFKFVYGDMGFNFKSCEMSASIALDRLIESTQL